MTHGCSLDAARPCSSTSRDPKRYTRSELVDIVESCNNARLQKVTEGTIDDMCKALEKTTLMRKARARARGNVDVHEWMSIVDDAKTFFAHDLLGFLDQKNPKFRVITSGGYGLKMLLETKHNMPNIIHTSDIDITVSVRNASFTPLQALDYWRRRINEFVASRPDKYEFKVITTSFKSTYVPVMNFNRYFYIGMLYKGRDFMDFAISDYPVSMKLFDIGASRMAKLPIKNEEGYLKEFLTLLYMETVPEAAAPYCYTQRNPITGCKSEKGKKDIFRAKVLCDVNKRKRYKKYCNIIKSVTVSKLRHMEKEDRDKYFTKLREIFAFKITDPRTIIKS